MRDVLAAGAQGRRGPEVHDDPARIVALVLEVAAHHLGGRALAERRGGPGRDGARIEGREVAAGRHHVAAARGRASPPGPGRTKRPSSAAQQARPLAPRAARSVRHEIDPGAGLRRRRAGRRGSCTSARSHRCASRRGQRLVHRRHRRRPRSRPDSPVCAAPRRGCARPTMRGPARIEHLAPRIFLDELAQDRAASPGRPACHDRRRQVAERDGAEPALGRRGLAGIVDDEGIDHRQRRRSRGAASRIADSATALPGSHSVVPCVPRWISASIRSMARRPR